MPAVVLSIAGSDPSGGAGIQADLKTFHAFAVYGAAVVASVTVQNTVGVRDRMDVPAGVVAAQIDAVLDDLPVAAVKTGLLPDAAVVRAVAARLRARPVPVLVVDPVLIATSGDALTDASALAALRDALIPIATLVTPNLSEASALTGIDVGSRAAMDDAAVAIVRLGAKAALVKGGHLAGDACDVLATSEGVHELTTPRVELGPVHGTGCTLSAAIAAELARGATLLDAVRTAKDYVRRALEASIAPARGSRVLDHGVPARRV